MQKNQWYVITGAPSAGKTTLLKELEKKGYMVIYEAARIIIDQEMKKGKKLSEIRKNELEFQKEVLRFKIDLEKKLSPKKTIFWERAIPDSIAYYKMCGVTNDPLLKKALKQCSYRKVFLLEMGNFIKDYARTEDPEKALRIQKLLEKSYRQIPCSLIKIPFWPIGKRLEFIVNHL